MQDEISPLDDAENKLAAINGRLAALNEKYKCTRLSALERDSIVKELKNLKAARIDAAWRIRQLTPESETCRKIRVALESVFMTKSPEWGTAFMTIAKISVVVFIIYMFWNSAKING